MVGERLSEFASGFSIDKILIGDFSDFVAVFYLVASIAIYSILIWHFYRYIAKRDCFKMSICRYPKLIGFVKYFFFFPFVAFLFFIGFSLMLIFLTKSYGYEDLLSTSFAIVIAIRITAYYSEDLSRDLAKMLPFALLGVVLVSPSYFDPGSIAARMLGLPDYLILGIQFIVFIILIEWILRISLAIRYAIFPKKQQISTED